MKPRKNWTNILELNLAVFFISTSGVLGKYIDLPVPVTIFSRAFIAAILLFTFAKVRGFDFKINTKDRISLLIGGILLGAHWITYFYALKFSNVALAMLSLYTFPAMTAILEPIILKKKFEAIHLILGLIVLLGIYLLAPSIDIQDRYFKGICLGLSSALFYAIRNIMLKSKVDSYNQSIVMLNQVAIVSILLVPSIGFFDSSRFIEFLPGTILLGLLTTAIGHTLFVHSLKHFSTTSASLISSLQPIYGIILAVIFLSESPSLRTMLGGLVIISTVVIESRRVNKSDKEP